jgi:hypothetical protein
VRRFRKHLELGLRWIKCGARLFSRNPWLLGGMGVCASAGVVVLVRVPLIGSPLVGLLVPALLASFYLAIDAVSKQKMKLPASLRTAAIKQSPREFLNIARDESRMLQVLVIGLFSLIVVVLTDILVWLAAGGAATNQSAGMHLSTLPSVIIGAVLTLAVYAVLAASVVYTVPLAVFRGQALVPAMTESMRHARHYAVALLLIVALLALPFLLASVVSYYAPLLGYLMGFAGGALVVPLIVCSFYCSYRTIFPTEEAARAVRADLRRAKYV